MHVYKCKVLAAETIWGSLVSNVVHLLMLSVIFNTLLVLPKYFTFCHILSEQLFPPVYFPDPLFSYLDWPTVLLVLEAQTKYTL